MSLDSFSHAPLFHDSMILPPGRLGDAAGSRQEVQPRALRDPHQADSVPRHVDPRVWPGHGGLQAQEKDCAKPLSVSH